jgi:hypothetical protein
MKFLLAFLFVCCFAFAVARPTARSAGSIECTSTLICFIVMMDG